ncbi:MAG: transcription termination/antitermination protein NusA [Oscillospiraceae bacterium]|nr:transcription termination/antitermination protein NusA [Oscillospiraceae bacterium]MBR3963394.1 transcription termination/antitermination protein NusA [Oscillospiraceae bacterium]MBR6656665.1 transcription termination/antitermination protein NusA [Oscillospiraceae bacterium]
MNAEFFEALALLEKEKGISVEYLCEKIENAIAIAIRRDYVGTEDVKVIIDPESKTFDVAIRKLVVEEVEDSANQILLDKAVKYNKKAQLGDVVDIPLETKEFGRIAAQTAKHVIKQGIREAERGQVLKEFQSREHEIITATVVSTDPVRGSVTLEIDHNEAFLLKSEQIPGEVFQDGERTKVYVVEVTASERGPKVMISRTHPGLVKRLFEIEVPEIYEGTVEIKAVSREAGSRTKLAVWSKDPDVDAVGACIGTRGARVAKIVDELGGEKIDVVQYSEDPAEFIAAALSPAKVVSVEVDPEGNKACKVKVPDEQLSLAIGNKGQNARLAARLTGWKIDIKPESGFWGEEE